MMEKQTDEQLYLKASRGDKLAFQELYERYEKPLFTFIFRYLKLREEAEEIFHETFIRLMKNKSLDFSKGRFRGWIYRVARNLCIDHVRKKNVKNVEVSIDEISSQENMMEQVQLRDQIIKMKDVARSLPSPFPELFNLKILGLSNFEISKIMDIPEGTVKSRTHKMLSLLRTEINKYGSKYV